MIDTLGQNILQCSMTQLIVDTNLETSFSDPDSGVVRFNYFEQLNKHNPGGQVVWSILNIHLRVIEWLENNLDLHVDYSYTGFFTVMARPRYIYFKNSECLLALRLATGL